MAHHQIVDCDIQDMEGSWEHIQKAMAKSRQGKGSSGLGVGQGANISSKYKVSFLQNVCHTGPWNWMLWNDLGNGKWTQDLEHRMLGVSKGQVH
jgi:hypothetical protein